MKKIVYIILCFSILISCKKKCEQEILPDTVITPTFWNQLTEEMVISIKNNQKDTVINFNANILKELIPNQPTNYYFDTLKYNNYETSILFSNTFLAQANNSIWQANSPLVGYINYIDTAKAPLCNDASNLALNTYSANVGIVLNLTNILNANDLDVTIEPLYYTTTFNSYFEFFKLNGTNTFNDTIVAPAYYYNINQPLVITLTFTNYRKTTINNITTYFAKNTIYKYISKRVQ